MLEVFIFLTFSFLTTTIIFGYYSVKVARQLMAFEDGFNAAVGSIEGFSEHLVKVNSYEVFNGEPIIEEMLEHSKDVIEDVKLFKEGFSIK